MTVKIDNKDIRETEAYQTMTSYHACELAEGFGAGEDAGIAEQLAGWQFICDTGMWRHLQGFYGRGVNDLLERGLIEPAKEV